MTDTIHERLARLNHLTKNSTLTCGCDDGAGAQALSIANKLAAQLDALQHPWQPIATCPKDDTVFLAVEVDDTGEYADTIDSVTWDGDGFYIISTGYTHWMHKPPPPQGEGHDK